jgi:phosphoenolpyruvate phosphomutase
MQAARFRNLLKSPSLTFFMEAHDGLSARLVEEAGFAGIWASGLTISAALGVRDCNEASWTQVLDIVECMADVTTIPILLDGDTGYGDFNNARRLVRKLCQRNIAALCIEDKPFPKRNSLFSGPSVLVDPVEFCGKIKACKDSQLNEEFCVIARVEALVAQQGMTEALGRAAAYAEAGADGILIHSIQPDWQEIREFCAGWQAQKPLVIVPTTYGHTPVSCFREAGISIVIWANHNLRAAIAAMRRVCARVLREESSSGVESEIATLDDIFQLTDQPELVNAERRYASCNPLTRSRPR